MEKPNPREDTAKQLARADRALQILRREVEALRCERFELLDQIEFLSRLTQGAIAQLTATSAPAPAPVAAPAPVPAAPAGGIPPEVMAVIAASVAVVLRGKRYSITGVEPVQKSADIERLMSLWSLEGRRQVYSSHSLPR